MTTSRSFYLKCVRLFFFFYTNPLFSDISFRGCLSRNENQCCLAYSEEQICNSNFNPLSNIKNTMCFLVGICNDSIVYIRGEVITSEAVCLCKNRPLSEK